MSEETNEQAVVLTHERGQQAYEYYCVHCNYLCGKGSSAPCIARTLKALREAQTHLSNLLSGDPDMPSFSQDEQNAETFLTCLEDALGKLDTSNRQD